MRNALKSMLTEIMDKIKEGLDAVGNRGYRVLDDT